MITLNTQPVISKMKPGTIRSNNKIYKTPSIFDKNWDICYKFEFPFNVLCNFTSSQFKHQGVTVNSMEGFLQSTKVKDRKTQEKICSLPGFMAKKVGNYLKRSGNFDRVTVYWQGKQYDRNSKEFQEVIGRAYDSKYQYDRTFRTVLDSSKGKTLTHTIGKSDPMDTVLTEEEFITHLNTLRDGKSLKNRVKGFFIGLKNLLFPQKTTKTIADKMSEYNATFINDIYVCGENPFNNIKKLKKSGVKNILDINATPEEAALREAYAKEHGLKYINIASDSQKKVLNPADTIRKVVDMYNEGQPTYIIAEDKRNANAVFAINYLYNPKATLPDALMFGTPQKHFVSRFISMEQSLSAEDKAHLDWSKEFRKGLAERKNTILELNA